MSQPTLDAKLNAAKAAVQEVANWDAGSHEATLEALEELLSIVEQLIETCQDRIDNEDYDEDDEDEEDWE